MQIRDMLGQYSQNVKNGTEELMSAQGTQKLVSSMQELEPGSTFEGTVNSVKNGKVVLALGNGQTITARLDGKVAAFIWIIKRKRHKSGTLPPSNLSCKMC